jgi:ubiquinol-cytochrome c reductase cytochrome b subunit
LSTTARQTRPRTSRLFLWADGQLRVSKGRQMLNHIFPDHWSFMLGELAMYSFLLLVVTGIFLTLYFTPSEHPVVYNGVYAPLRGVTMSEAYKSTLDLTFAVRAGLLMRQVHHWAADIFVGAIVVHLGRVFFTGAFRRPRTINWMIGATMLMFAIFNGFLGYSLPDDMVSGIGVRIAYSITESIPIVGSYLASWLWGGTFPGHVIDERFYIIHVLILPGFIAIFLAIHLMLIWTQEHTEFKKAGASETTITGTPLWPGFMAKSAGFMLTCWGVMAALGAFVQINPIWQFGPFDPTHATDAAQPDWYMGWLEGALRLWPPWETVFPGHMVPAPFYPAVALPILTWILLYSWPFLEEHFTGDRRHHNLLDHPRDRPFRTAFGTGMFVFYFLLFVAGGDDVLANFFNVQIQDLVWGLRIAVIVVPVLSGVVAHRICVELQRQRPRTSRPRYVIVERAEAGYYATADGLPVPGKPELEPKDVEEAGDEAAELVREGPTGRRRLTAAISRSQRLR